MGYDALVINAHPDDAETQMGGTLARLSDLGQRIAIVDLTDGEPSDLPEPGQFGEKAAEAARVRGVERISLGGQDRLLSDTSTVRLEVARLIREHRPEWVYGTDDACVHPDHAATVGLTRAAVFLAGLQKWDRVPGGERLAGQDPWKVGHM